RVIPRRQENARAALLKVPRDARDGAEQAKSAPPSAGLADPDDRDARGQNISHRPFVSDNDEFDAQAVLYETIGEQACHPFDAARAEAFEQDCDVGPVCRARSDCPDRATAFAGEMTGFMLRASR